MDLKITKKFYSTKGVVYGRTWNFTDGGYATRSTGEFSTKEEVIAKLNEMLEDGSIDSGFGFESLYGAYCSIVEESSAIIDGDVYVNRNIENVVIGTLPKWASIDVCEEHLEALLT